MKRNHLWANHARGEAPEDEPAIVIDQLVVSYGARKVLNGLSLTVPRGSIFGLLGANGAGKTTMINTLLGFRRAQRGSARVLGYDIANRSRGEIRARVGYVSETNSLYEWMTVPQLCRFCRDTNRHWNQEVVDRYLHFFAVPEKQKIRQFSKGMQSLLALCLALGNEPELLLLDEPTTGLDPVARQMFLKTLIADVAGEGRTVFFSSHLLCEIEAICDRLAILRDGQIMLSDELDHVRQSQQVLRVIYAQRPPDQEVERLQALPGVIHVEQEGRGVRVRTSGEIDVLIAYLRAQPYEVRDIESLPLSLDAILLDYLQGEHHGKEGTA